LQLSGAAAEAWFLSMTGRQPPDSDVQQPQMALGVSAQGYRFLFESMPLPMWVFGEDTLAFLAVNEAAIQHYQYSREEFLAMTIKDIRPPEELPRLAAQLVRHGGGLREAGTWKHRKKDGTLIDVDVCSRSTEWEGKRTRLVLAQDVTEQKKAEAALRESEDRYRDLVENSNDLICTHDLQGRILSLNPAPARILGYEPHEMLHMQIQDILSPAARPLFDEYLAAIRRDGEARGVLRAVTRSGEKRIWEYHNTLRTEGVPAPVVRGMAHDITDRWRAEKALKASEELFSKVFHSSPDPICITTLEEWRILDVNESFLRISGFPREELIGATFPALSLAATSEEREKIIAAMRETGRVRNLEARLRMKSGEERIWLLSLEPMVVAGQACVVGVHKDVTEFKRAEAALRESEQRFRQLAESIADVFWLYDVEKSQTLYVNPAFEQVLGHPCEALYRNSHLWLECIHPDDRERIGAEYDQALKTGMINHEYRIVRPDGSVRWLRERGFGVRDDRGVIRRFAGIAEDVTEREQLEDLLRQAQKMEAVGRLAGGVAHDFNNLLTIIMGYCEQLKRQPLTEGAALNAVGEIHLAADRAAALTRQLLAFSRKQRLEPQVLDLNLLIAEVETILRRALGEDIELELALQADLWPVKVDRFQFEQVVLNLAVNARDSMPSGGRLTIITSNAQPDEASVRSHPGSSTAPCTMLAVKDTGVGMDACTRERIFEPFFTTKDVGKGTGLGLATVYGIVKQSGGSIAVESEPGAGSTFRIYLPAVRESLVSAPRGPAGPFPFRGHETILLVEDDDRVRQLLHDFLEQCGYPVKAARNGAEALRIAREYQHHIDLLLTDLVMPGMSGTELARELTRERQGIRLLFVSGHSEHAGLRNYEMQSGSAFLQKPFSLDSLGRKVREVLDAPQQG
jgi:two-component system cell cycle sensor histidine kinase/response regulator CckA